MDPADWDELALDLIARLKTRIAAKWVTGIEWEVAGGEFAMAVEDVTAVLAEDQVPITAAEHDDLRRLVDDLGTMSEEISRLNIEQNDGGAGSASI